MISEIPIDVTTATDDGEITFDVELDGTTYQLQLSYAPCAQLWYLSIFLVASGVVTPIAQGLALVTAIPLLIAVQVPDRPAGELMVVGDRDAGREDLGTFCKLRYYDAAELATL